MYNYAPSEIPWADYRDLITGLSLEYGVSSLCASAFSGCAKLAELSIPEGLNSPIREDGGNKRAGRIGKYHQDQRRWKAIGIGMIPIPSE